jgi:hypothetical protein
MRQVRVFIENIPGSPYSQSAQHDTPFLDRESHEDYDARTWRNHCTTNREGIVCIPAMANKQCIDTAAYKLGEKVPGRRGATFKTFFASGFFCDADAPISNGKPLKPEDADMVIISANPGGKRGGQGRVPRRFPEFKKYAAIIPFTIIDDLLTQQIFEQHVKAAGMIVGIGRFRPENGGTNGRFRPTKFEWKEFQL